MEGLVEAAVMASNSNTQVAAILGEVLDIAVSKAYGQSRVEPTEELRRELDWHPEVEREELIPPSDPAQFQRPVSSVACHPGPSSEQERAQSICLANSYQEVSNHPTPSSQDILFFKAVEVSRRSFDWQSQEEEELVEPSPPSYLVNSPTSSEIGYIRSSSEPENEESLPNCNQDAPTHPSPSSEDFPFLKAVEESYEGLNWQTEEEDELTPPSFLNSPSTSELHMLERCGNTPSSMESSSREGSQQCAPLVAETDSTPNIMLSSQPERHLLKADSVNSESRDNFLGLETKLTPKSKRQRTSSLSVISEGEMLRGSSDDNRRKNNQAPSAEGDGYNVRNVEISDGASSECSYSLEDEEYKEPVSIRQDSYEEIFDSSAAVEAPKLCIKDQPKLLHRAPRLGLSRQQNPLSIHQVKKRAFFSLEADDGQSLVLEE